MMPHVVTNPRPPFRTRDGRLEIHQIPAATDNLIWLAVCTETRVAAAVDGPGVQEVLRYCEAHDFDFQIILNTHTHPDHVGINRELDSQGRLNQFQVYGAKSRAVDIPGLTHPLEEGDTVCVGRVDGRVMLTEGHIDGHLSFLFEDVLFCGDTMFAAGCGYLFDGPPQKMFESLSRFRSLDPATRICCAHEYTQDNLRFAWSIEPDNSALAKRIRDVWSLRERGGCAVPSTLAEECQTNPFLRWDSPSLRAHVQAAWPKRALTLDMDVFAATRALKDRKDYRSLSDENLPLS